MAICDWAVQVRHEVQRRPGLGRRKVRGMLVLKVLMVLGLRLGLRLRMRLYLLPSGLCRV